MDVAVVVWWRWAVGVWKKRREGERERG